MTLVSEIISDAFRASNLIPVAGTPSTDEATEALRYLNRLVKSVFGHEVGDPLVAFPLGQNNIARPAGFPSWDVDPGPDWFVPKDTRLILNLEAPLTVYLHPMPSGGTRFAVNDTAGNIATNTVTVYGNGRTIEGANSVTLSTNGLDKEWFFREDLGNWVATSPLISTDTFPFPEEFDDFFVMMLALRINPSFGMQMDAQAQQFLTRGRAQLRARYKQNISVNPQEGTWRLTGNKDCGESQPSFGDLGHGFRRY